MPGTAREKPTSITLNKIGQSPHSKYGVILLTQKDLEKSYSGDVQGRVGSSLMDTVSVLRCREF